MNYGPGASVVLWKTFFPQAELWEAEYVKECVDKAVKNKQVEGINLLVGDQADYNVLDSWIEKSGGSLISSLMMVGTTIAKSATVLTNYGLS